MHPSKPWEAKNHALGPSSLAHTSPGACPARAPPTTPLPTASHASSASPGGCGAAAIAALPQARKIVNNRYAAGARGRRARSPSCFASGQRSPCLSCILIAQVSAQLLRAAGIRALSGKQPDLTLSVLLESVPANTISNG